MITEQTIDNFFKDLKIKGDFNPLKKTYLEIFFYRFNKDNLREVADILNEKRYTFVDIFEAEKDDENDLTEHYFTC
jgi:hypothetical protein